MRLWERYETVCPVLTPEEAYANKILYKNNILKYKANSTSLTKQQKYAYLSNNVGNKNQNCTSQIRGQITVGMSPNLVLLNSKNINSSYYPKIKRTMHVASTNWPHGANSGTYIAKCNNLGS
jgi:hypothetical protein